MCKICYFFPSINSVFCVRLKKPTIFVIFINIL
nr:MAG TPA: hypothetical protein [Caudoviricetes sp.]DAJ62625.1 MAG TPA: hypothetical protein [Caudoviricetes sp.]